MGVPGEQLPAWAHNCRSLPVCPYYDCSCRCHNSAHHNNSGRHNDNDPVYYDHHDHYYHHYSGFLRQ